MPDVNSANEPRTAFVEAGAPINPGRVLTGSTEVAVFFPPPAAQRLLADFTRGHARHTTHVEFKRAVNAKQ